MGRKAHIAVLLILCGALWLLMLATCMSAASSGPLCAVVGDISTSEPNGTRHLADDAAATAADDLRLTAKLNGESLAARPRIASGASRTAPHHYCHGWARRSGRRGIAHACTSAAALYYLRHLRSRAMSAMGCRAESSCSAMTPADTAMARIIRIILQAVTMIVALARPVCAPIFLQWWIHSCGGDASILTCASILDDNPLRSLALEPLRCASGEVWELAACVVMASLAQCHQQQKLLCRALTAACAGFWCNDVGVAKGCLMLAAWTRP